MDVRTETINLLEENIVGKLLDIDLDDNFLTPKAKINIWDYVKLKSFSTAKEPISKMKRQLSEWEKISANNISDKGLTLKISNVKMKNSYNSIVKNPNNLIKNGQMI